MGPLLISLVTRSQSYIEGSDCRICVTNGCSIEQLCSLHVVTIHRTVNKIPDNGLAH